MCSHTTVQRRKHGCSTAAEQQLQQRCPYAVNAIAVLLRAKQSASASHPPTPFSRMRLVCDSSDMTPAMAGKPLTGCFTVTCLPLRATASDEWLFPKTNAENEVGGGGGGRIQCQMMPELLAKRELITCRTGTGVSPGFGSLAGGCLEGCST